jgi:TrmH family RNA methyltransferase
MPLSSLHNPLLKKVRQAAELGRALEDGCLVAEGPHLLGEALRSQWQTHRVLVSSDGMRRFPALLTEVARQGRIEVIEVAERAFQAMAPSEHSQGVMALVEPRKWEWADVHGGAGPVVILDGIQDPGNAGTIVRSAEAFGAAGVVFGEGSVRIANAKLLRASAGSIFRLPFLEGVGAAELIEEARSSATMLYALSAGTDTGLCNLPVNSRFAFIVGSEGLGVRSVLKAAATALAIPTSTVESLNAAVACSIALFEAARQRTGCFQKAI